MNKRVQFFAASFFCLMAVVLIACKREYSYEGGRTRDSIPVVILPPQAALFTLAGAPNDCSNPVINGTYTARSGLTTSNYITITVNVTAPGTYAIKTDTVDGMSFSATGTFNTTGNVSVKLAGSGKPDAAGLYYFTPNTGTSTCSFAIPVQNDPPWASYVLESGYGSPNPCTYTVAGVYKTATPLNNANSVTIQVYVAALGNFTIQTNKLNGIDFEYTGTFTTTGTQQVILYGRGTPQSAGNFSFAPRIIGPSPLGGQSCSFNVAIQ